MTGLQPRPHARILIVLHQEHSSPGRVGQLLAARGFDLDIRRPPLGDPLPETLAGHAGAVIFGGPMSANDPDEFVRRETDWLKVPLAENKPFLGICLGAQMLVNHLGGKVGPRDDELVEIGWYPLEATEAGTRLLHWPRMVYQFHREGFSLPSGASLLATAERYPNQAFRYGQNAWGIQFHAELTRVMMHKWVVKGAHRFVLPGAQLGREHLDGRMIWDTRLRAWLDEFLTLVFGDPKAGASSRRRWIRLARSLPLEGRVNNRRRRLDGWHDERGENGRRPAAMTPPASCCSAAPQPLRDLPSRGGDTAYGREHHVRPSR